MAANQSVRWRNPSLAVNAILTDSLERIYLVRRNEPPFKGMLSLPGGYVEYGETVEHALKRELKEELNVNVVKTDFAGVYSDPSRHPEKHVVALLYRVTSDKEPAVTKKNEIGDGGFYDPRSIREPLAFDHAKMILDSVSRLRS
ncbi:MAG: NUDIX hydrolase [Thaumarchaeota archaeon]|nr:NUDIX hydrolase [Nitrososphaerota archaeon]